VSRRRADNCGVTVKEYEPSAPDVVVANVFSRGVDSVHGRADRQGWARLVNTFDWTSWRGCDAAVTVPVAVPPAAL
jgi:hypothetical protein